MPNVIDIRPVGVQVTVTYTAEELKLLSQAYDRCEITVDLSDTKQKGIHDYFVKTHAPFVSDILKNLKEQGMIEDVS